MPILPFLARLDFEVRDLSVIKKAKTQSVSRLTTDQGFLLLKTYEGVTAQQMRDMEVDGLTLLALTNTIGIPKIKDSGTFNKDAYYLIIDFIESGNKSIAFWEEFGRNVARLHKSSNVTFGHHCNNFIGSLPQRNTICDSWHEFYRTQRLMPQADLAFKSGVISLKGFRQIEDLCNKIESICPKEAPSLVHGDLWSGNFLCSIALKPFLIDPSVAFAHREMDLAMSRLFGGFHSRFYSSYEEAFALTPGFDRRIRIYQLYYLLVHLNLFGESYYSETMDIVQEYT